MLTQPGKIRFPGLPGWWGCAPGPFILLFAQPSPKPPILSSLSPVDWIQLISLLIPSVLSSSYPSSQLGLLPWRTPNDR